AAARTAMGPPRVAVPVRVSLESPAVRVREEPARSGGAGVSGNAFLEFVERYGPPAGEIGPVRFVREVWGAEPDTWQEKGLRAYGRGERRISIRSCHGPGKTTLLAWLVNYQLCTRFPQKTAATAPTTSQLEDALVAEVLAWHRKLPAALQALFTLKK